MFKAKKSQYKYNAIVSTTLVVGILIVLGVISTKIFFRIDLTENKQFSVSKATIKTLKELDDIVQIKAYFSEELPADLLGIKQDTQDLLGEYKNYARSNLQVDFIDPKDDLDLKEEAKGYGIPELQFSNMEKDKFEVSMGYLGIAILYGGRKEIIPAIKDTNTLEYDLTAGIKKVILAEPIKVGFLTGHGELSQSEDLSGISSNINKLYNVVNVDITDGNLIEGSIKTLVVAGPTEKLSARDKYVIDQFLMNGGNLLVLSSRANVSDTLSASENTTGLEEIIEHYGVRINKDLALDSYCEMVQFSSGYSIFMTQYPFWPKINSDGFNQESVITSKLENLVLPWSSSLEILDGKISGGESQMLIVTSGKSWTDNTFNISPEVKRAPTEFNRNILAVSVTGKFESFFKGKEIPRKNQEAEMGAVGVASDVNFVDFSTKENRIIVIGNSQFVKDNFIQRFPDNQVFFQNALDGITMDEALISIRSRVSSSRPLKSDISDTTKTVVKFLNIFLIAALLAVFGIIRWMISRRSKRDSL